MKSVLPSKSRMPGKTLDSCQWPPVRNEERLFGLSQTWASWWGLDMTNFLRMSVAFFIVVSKVFDMFRHEQLQAFYKIDRVLPLDQ